MDPRKQRGPVIERANEPGMPRGFVRLLIVGVIGWAAYASGYLPDLGVIERGWRDVTVAVNDLWNAPEKPAPTPAPTQTARPSIAPPISRPSPSAQPSPIPPPPPPAAPNFNQIIADAKRAIAPTTPPAEPKQPDPFADAFRRDVLGQLSSPKPAPPAVASAPPPAASPTPVEPPRTSIFPRPPGVAPAPFMPGEMDTFVERELNSFNASREVPVKRAAMAKVVAAAQIGHGPARGVIVRGYPASTIIRDVIAPADAIRFALDFVIHKRAFSNDARRDFMALAAWFDGERKDATFGEAVFDAIRDDPRLQTPDAMNDLMYLLYRAERGCIALRRHINVFDPSTTTMGHCGNDLAAATPDKARQAGPAGVEGKRFREAVQLLQKEMAEPI